MDSIEVEAVESVDAEDVTPEGVDAPEYVIYGGKGGVGKTTMAAATALASANDGTPTLAVSTDPAHSLSDVLETPIPDEPERIREDMPLYGVEIDPESAETPFEGAGPRPGPGPADGGGGSGRGSSSGSGGSGGFDFGPGSDSDGGFGLGGGAGPAPGQGDAGAESGFGVGEGFGAADATFGAMNPMGGATPGADEAAAVQLLLEYMDDPRFERVVIDTAPTGHTLRLLRLPEAMDTMVGRMRALQERLSGMLGDAPGPFGDPDAADVDGLREFAARIERLRDALRDPARTDFRVVMVPERLSVIESERLLRELEDYGVAANTVVVNRVTSDVTDLADVDADAFPTPNPESCSFCSQRWESQQAALSRAHEVFRDYDVERVPLFAREVSGEGMLRVIAACLN